jgi:hypothetical protein
MKRPFERRKSLPIRMLHAAAAAAGMLRLALRRRVF